MIPIERLWVAELAHQFALSVYSIATKWSDRILSAQIRRAALSIPSNIVEGAGRETKTEFARFVGIAYSSAAEVRYQLRFAEELGLITETDAARLEQQVQQIRRMLWSLRTNLRNQAKIETGRRRKGTSPHSDH